MKHLSPSPKIPFGADVSALERLARDLRYQVVQLSHNAGTPHLGSALSCIDILVAAYWRAARIDPAKADSFTRCFRTLRRVGRSRIFSGKLARFLRQPWQPARRTARSALRTRRRACDRFARPRPTGGHWYGHGRPTFEKGLSRLRRDERWRVQRRFRLGGSDVRARTAPWSPCRGC